MIKAHEAEVGKKYFSPKGVPCKVIEINLEKENVILVSLSTGNNITVPLEFPLQEDKMSENVIQNVPQEVPQEVSQEQPVKKERKKHVRSKESLYSILIGIALAVEVGNVITWEKVLEVLKVKMPNVEETKALSNFRTNVLYNVKKHQGVELKQLGRKKLEWKRIS